jgi:two-component system, NtrC family, sensor histidine kinase AtoS
MKKKIIILLSLAFLFALGGGVYLLFQIKNMESNLRHLVMLHKVESLRENVLLNIQSVEADLLSQSTMLPESPHSVELHIGKMRDSIQLCTGCHHEEDVLKRLLDLQSQTDKYGAAVKKVLDRSMSARQSLEARARAHLIGVTLTDRIESMIILTKEILNRRTEHALRAEHRTRALVILIVFAGPVFIALFGILAARSFTQPITMLVEATRKLKSGELDYRVSGLKDEFSELASSFNDMAMSLRKNMRAIAESEARYRHLFESAADAILILDLEGDRIGRILQANPAAAAMHGYSVEELQSMNLTDLLTPDALLGFETRAERILGGQWVRSEINHRKKDGTTFPVEIGVGAFDVGGHKYVLAIDRDITERKLAEEALQRAQQIRISGELATGLAHEIKNPLAGIKLAIQMLLEAQCLSTEDRIIVKKVIDEIKRIEQLMKSLLNFARPPQPQLAPTNVNAVLDTVASLVLHGQALLRDGIQIVRDLEENLPLILADPMQLHQIFMNVILNAVDAMPEGGTITFRTEFNRASSTIQIDISDTGPGFDTEMLNQTFKPFCTSKAKGTGLGLAITKRLVEDHGGSIRIENNVERGALVRIILPARETNPATPG